jgi:GNAT superfamily N-acetyltransferase
MPIVKYTRKEWGTSVTELFARVYPDLPPVQSERMAYDENLPLHQLTLLAVNDRILVGQINVFRIYDGAALGNVGYHVHPDWRRKGIASLLLCQAWPSIAHAFADGLVIQTVQRNRASMGLALKAGFVAAAPELVEKYGRRLKCTAHTDGLCFHLPSTQAGPTEALQRSALRAAGL